MITTNQFEIREPVDIATDRLMGNVEMSGQCLDRSEAFALNPGEKFLLSLIEVERGVHNVFLLEPSARFARGAAGLGAGIVRALYRFQWLNTREHEKCRSRTGRRARFIQPSRFAQTTLGREDFSNQAFHAPNRLFTFV